MLELRIDPFDGSFVICLNGHDDKGPETQLTFLRVHIESREFGFEENLGPIATFESRHDAERVRNDLKLKLRSQYHQHMKIIPAPAQYVLVKFA